MAEPLGTEDYEQRLLNTLKPQPQASYSNKCVEKT